MNLINQFYNFYDQRNFREKILLVLLSFAFWYFVYQLAIISWIDNVNLKKSKEYSALSDKINVTNRQIELLKQALTSSSYKQWINQEKVLSDIQEKYHQYVTAYSPTDSQAIIKLLLNSRDNLNILEIKSEPSKPYEFSGKIKNITKLYQKPYITSLLVNYREFYPYMQRIETVLKSVAWNRLSYEVTQYPIAKVEVEFSILYEKT